MRTVADVRKGQTYMSYKGEHQMLTKQSIRHQVCSGGACLTILESAMTILIMLMSRGSSNCGVDMISATRYGVFTICINMSAMTILIMLMSRSSSNCGVDMISTTRYGVFTIFSVFANGMKV